MPDFAYVARNTTGQKITGTINAPNQRDVLAALAAKSLFPLHVDTSGAVVQQRQAGKRVKAQLMASFYSQLAGLLKSGVPMLRSLDVLKKQSSHGGLSEIISQIHSQVEEGASLGDAMARFPRTFNEMSISMVRAGSEGGFLEDALQRVAQFTEQQADMAGKTIGALVYPGFIATIGFVIVSCLMIFFVPQFDELFQTMRARGELPQATELLLWISNVMCSPWLLVPVAFFAIGVWQLQKYLQTEPGKQFRDKWILKIPVLGGILLSLAVARFCRVLGTLLHNGVAIIKALDISSSAAGNRVIGKAITSAAENISAGQSLAKPLAASGHFPATITEMISIAEESNSLDTVLVEIADGLEKRTWRQLDMFVKLLEPLMLLILAGVVLFVVIGLLYPILNMSNSV